ncbi:assimilatory nitrate reductase catalytic subunit NasC [Bacillus benzoevorans]|uniref:Assimilatory nitrate reductase catalytic subunit n=2 Tax=Bacillus benzoevorans TaxID=1456 RepID=A0A7X0HTL3_9BACI|nr:molybdopterin oxidoreductase family protein [Bacillus benzoevorans]MBB6446583.1 assimilatory nitrate reductase catalytic subunit [Bacillus benzoevorans]
MMASKVMDTQCPFCSVQCKMQIMEKEEAGKTTYTVQPKANAASEGRLCIKGMNAYQHGLSEERVTEPLLNKDGVFTPVTWEEAYEFIAKKFRDIQGRFGHDVIGVYGGGSLTNETSYLLGKFARIGLQTKYIDYNGRFCMSAAAAASNAAFGMDRGLTNPLSDIRKTKCLILAGTNIAECQPTLMPYFMDAKENGAYIIVVDPRDTATAEMADLHLKVKPGTDVALASAMLKILLEEGYVDHSFVRERTTGFAEVKKHVAALDFDELVSKIGVSLEDLKEAAIRFGSAASGMILTARGVEQQTDGYLAVRNYINLLLVTGKIGKPGSGYGAVTGQANGQGGREHGQKADQLPGYRYIENDNDRAYMAGIWGVHPSEIPHKGVSAYEMMKKVHAQEIRALFLMGSNPILSNPNAGFVEEGIRKLDLLVAVDMFLSETAQLAHVILPAASFLENEGTLTNLEGRVLLREAARPVPGMVKQDWEILCDIAGRMGKGSYFPYGSAEEIFAELRRASRGGMADYYGITYDRLRKEEGIYWPCPTLEHPGEKRLFTAAFAHSDGKAKIAIVNHHYPKERVDEQYPLILTTGRVLEHYLTGVQTRKSVVLASRKMESFVEIHPKTAQRWKIKDDTLVKVNSRRGQIVVRSKLTDSIREDTVFVPMHWGGLQNVNKLTCEELDPTCKMPGFKICAVSIEPLLT